MNIVNELREAIVSKHKKVKEDHNRVFDYGNLQWASLYSSYLEALDFVISELDRLVKDRCPECASDDIETELDEDGITLIAYCTNCEWIGSALPFISEEEHKHYNSLGIKISGE